MSDVYFCSTQVKELRAEASLPGKFERALNQFDLSGMFAAHKVAVKMHLGGGLGYTTIHPLFVRLLVEGIKQAGGAPFITDREESALTAAQRGYTAETLAAPIYPAAGLSNDFHRTAPLGYRELETIELAGMIESAPAMVVLSHVKAHGQAGLGGAIKNLGMGAVTSRSRGAIHRLMDASLEWDENACSHCETCQHNCPEQAISFNQEGRIRVDFHACRYCLHCVTSCPSEALTIDSSGIGYFQEGLARATKVVLDTFEPGRVLFVNVLLDITPLCDCWGFTTPSMVPDIGIMLSRDVVSLEQATLDAIKVEDFIPGSLPTGISLGEGGHLLERLWGKDPYLQVEAAARLGLGERSHQLIEVE